jgi:hypothetical protein
MSSAAGKGLRLIDLIVISDVPVMWQTETGIKQ